MATIGAVKDEHYRCGLCGQKFHHPSLIYCCDNGHILCRACYARADTGQACPHRTCKSNLFIMDTTIKVDNVAKTERKSNKLFPEPERIAKDIERQRLSKRSVYSLFKGDTFSSHSLLHSSRRPINCPYPGCEKTIAVASIGHHFKCEHKYVALISTYYENRNGLQFNPYDVRYNEKLCIVLISIVDGTGAIPYESEKVSRSSLKLPPDPATTKPVMLVMATRIPFYQLYECEDSSYDYEPTEAEGHGMSEEGEKDNEANREKLEIYNCPPADKILLWVASNLPSNTKYTVALSTSSKSLRMKYFGTISQINDSAIKLCEGGRGLILSQPHAVGMTNHGRKPLTLDIVLHRDELERH